MINFNNVTKIFKTDFLSREFKALDDVSFNIPEGSMVGFLGANGAGKTTSLKIIMDFIRATEGSVEFSSQLGKNRQDIFKNIGFLPERPYFYPNLTGREFLTFMGTLSELKKNELSEQIKLWSPRFKIDHALERELKTYSKGMLQRIGFLATLLHHPKMIILDEPLSGLDPIGRKELKDAIIEVHKEGKTVFFSTHIVPDVEEVCDRVIFLKEGKLIYDGNVSSLINKNENDYIVITSSISDELTTPTKLKQILPDGMLKFLTSADNKDKLLKEIVSSNAPVHSVEMIKPSLEEIFYHTQDR